MIYQGHHGDARARTAPIVILPGAAYTEKNGTYVNTEGRMQRFACKAAYPPGEAKRGLEDHPARILRCGQEKRCPTVYDSLGELRARLDALKTVFFAQSRLQRFGVTNAAGPNSAIRTRQTLESQCGFASPILGNYLP